VSERDPSTISSHSLAALAGDLVTARHKVPDPRTHKQRLRRARLRRVLLVLLAGLLLVASLPLLALGWYSRDLPSVQSLSVYEPPVVTQVRDEQGTLVGEFFKEQRYVVPFEAVPANLRNAFVAAEDAAFWEHKGLDYEGIARAFLKNIRQGRLAQGGSTITQQVARSFLLSREKTLGRKVREALLSRRIETSFSKEHILYLYLNQIFLGHGAYGVDAAARLYFGKPVGELTLGESAMIAGLPQAPSRYSPNRNYKAAKARQRYVLTEMVDRGYITGEQANAAEATELTFARKADLKLHLAPHYVEHVRRYLFDQTQEAERRGARSVDGRSGHAYDGLHPLTSGLTVTIPIDLELQATALDAVGRGVTAADRVMGWRGPSRQLAAEADRAVERAAIDRERAAAVRAYHPGFVLPEGPMDPREVPSLAIGEETRAVVHEVGERWALLAVGSRVAVMSLQSWSWCHHVNAKRNFRGFRCRRFDDMLTVGDVVPVRVEAEAQVWDALPASHVFASASLAGVSMQQLPGPEAALLTMRTSDGAVLAMVGGSSFAASEFNRALQAQRQIGSTFKPFVYAAAMDHPEMRLSPGSEVFDTPLTTAVAGPDGKAWAPRNSSGDYMGATTLRQSLVLSRNLVTVRICEQMGVQWMLRYARRFGFDSPLEKGLASCLGTSSLTVREMVEAYSVFATLGDRVDARFLTEVRDRHGAIVERVAPVIQEQVVSETTAWLMDNMLTDVVQQGTARRARALGLPVAGKTGTTNNYRDAWFLGYSPEIVTGVWVGMDGYESLGRGQYGGSVALPIWMDVMQQALLTYPPSPRERPEGVKLEQFETRDGYLVPLHLGGDVAQEDIGGPLIEERLYRATDGAIYRGGIGRGGE